MELMNMPVSYVSALYQIAEARAKTEEGQKQQQGEALEDGLEELM